MKKMLLPLAFLLVFSACTALDSDREILDEVLEEELVEHVEVLEEIEIEEVEVVAVADFDLVAVSVEGSSVLVDNTNIGFNYEAEMLLDKDFSTAWCVDSADEEKILSMDFGKAVELGELGIVPGFARDETIYYQNERVSEVELLVGVGKEVETLSFDLLDEYGMQFIDLSGKTADSIQLIVKDTYGGSKYDDICIAELDFWSDYVVNTDKIAANNYYNQYKKDSALKPYDIIGAVKMSTFSSDTCGEFVADGNYNDKVFEGAYFFDAGSHVYASGIVNEYGSVGDEVDVYWQSRRLVSELGNEIREFSDWESFTGEDVFVEESCKGNFFVHSQMPEVAIGYLFGETRVLFYKDGKMIGKAYYNLVQ
jgi:hypothetical protein